MARLIRWCAPRRQGHRGIDTRREAVDDRGHGHALPIPMWPQIIDAIDKHAHGAVAKAA